LPEVVAEGVGCAPERRVFPIEKEVKRINTNQQELCAKGDFEMLLVMDLGSKQDE
jgi:hypothetical protein